MITPAHIVGAVLLLGLAAADNAAADCTCRARGVVAKHGQTICIPTPQGQRLARCDKVLNVASWSFLPAPCPLAAGPISSILGALEPAQGPSRPALSGPYWLALSD